MEQIDPQKAQRVWQRVRGEEPANAPLTALQSLAAAEWTQASAYLLLSRQMQGEEKELLRKLSRPDWGMVDIMYNHLKTHTIKHMIPETDKKRNNNF